MTRRIVDSDRAPAAIGPYSQAIGWQDILFCAGQIPLDPTTGKLVEGDVQEQVRRVIANLGAVLEEGGSSLEEILRLDVYVTDLSVFPDINEELGKVFVNDPPARVTIEVSGLPMGAQVEIAAIAAISCQSSG